MSHVIEIKVPDIGDFKEVDVIEVLVAVGQTVAVDDALITLESDKASMDIPSSHAGTISCIIASAFPASYARRRARSSLIRSCQSPVTGATCLKSPKP